MSLGLRSKILLFFGFLALISIGNFGIHLLEEKNASVQQSWLSHTHNVIKESDAFLNSLLNAETGQRGFLLTGQNEYLEPYNIGITSAQTQFARLKELTRDNSMQQSRLADIQRLMVEKFNELEQTIRIMNQGNSNAAWAIVKDNHGKDFMDSIRQHFEMFRAEEDRLLAIRTSDFRSQQKLMKLIYTLEALFFVGIIIFAGYRIQTHLVKPILNLTKISKKLAAGEGAGDIPILGNDEISQLSEAFNNMHHQVLKRSQELKNQAHYDQSFSHAVTACTSSLDITKALSDALIIHSAHHPSPLGAIYVYDEATDRLRCLVSHGTSDAMAKTASAEYGLIGQVYRADEPLLVGAESAEGFHIDTGLANFSPRVIALQPINYSDKKLGVLVLAYTVDLTERDQQYIANLADQFGISIVNAKKSEQLKYEIDVKDKFFSIVSHDLKSPFTSLLGMTQLMSEMAEKFSKKDLVEQARDVNKSGEQVYELLHNLLDWSRLQMDGAKVDVQTISLWELTQESIEILSPLAKEKNITLTNNIKEASAFADKEMVQTVIRNLIANAVKFTPLGGSIEMSSHINQNTVQITVSDNGVGMTQKHAKQVFALDQKTSTKGTAGERGTGLGLPLCKDLLERNGGKIWLETTEGQGSQFHFSLPIEL